MMLLSKSFFGQMDGIRDLLGQPPRGPGGFDTTDTLIILGFVLILAFILFSWAYFIRKRPQDQFGSRVLTRPPRRRRRRSKNAVDTEVTTREHRRRRRRRRAEPDMHRNPTLGETGGLPPRREESPQNPASPPRPSSSEH